MISARWAACLLPLLACQAGSGARRHEFDGERARETRRRCLESWCDRPVLILGTHFAAPTAGHIVRDGDAWRFEV